MRRLIERAMIDRCVLWFERKEGGMMAGKDIPLAVLCSQSASSGEGTYGPGRQVRLSKP
jgi:hypothetical protein